MSLPPVPFLEAYKACHGITYNELAKRLDFDPGNLWRLMTTKNRSVRAETACKFAQRLGITVEVLMGKFPEPKNRA